MIFGGLESVFSSTEYQRRIGALAAQQSQRIQGLSGLAGFGAQNQLDVLSAKIKKDDELRKIPKVDFYVGDPVLKSLRDHIVDWAKL